MVNEGRGLDIYIPAKEKFSDLFGERVINGMKLNVEQVIYDLTLEFRQQIDEILNKRREWLESKQPLSKKGYFPKWDDRFEDADGNIRTFREIIQGLLDNFFDRNTPLRWRLNDNVPIPEDAHPLKNPGLELTGPWYPLSRAIHQINADVAVAFEDEEDASPAWFIPHSSYLDYPAVWYGRRNVKTVLSGNVPTPYYEKGKEYRILKPRDKWPTVFHRVPGIHLLDPNVIVEGKPAPAIIVSMVIYALNNYEYLKKAGSGIYFYVPKVQTPDEALVIEKILRRLEEKMGLKIGTIKIAMLYEEGNAGRYLPVILWIWRERLVKSSNGRWDYLGSLIEMWKDEGVFPDPQKITMTSPNMMVYQRYNALIMLMAGLKNGEAEAAPVGGMAAVMLYRKTDPYKRFRYNHKALRGIKLDKLRERLIGLIFIPDEDVNVGEKITLSDILEGRVKGKLYDVFRQSWVATKEESYVAAGNKPLRAPLEKLQEIIDAKVEYVEVDGEKLPTVESGLTESEKKRFIELGLLNEEGEITPWVIPKTLLDSPEKLFSHELWGGKDLWHGLYDIPEGDITIEHIQHAFYMAANYGFQILNGNLAAAIDDYELGQRFMNDLATYRIFVSWLWTLIHHEAKITKDGYLKKPALTDKGVIPAVNAFKVEAGTRFDRELFEKVWEYHWEWTREFYSEYDRRIAREIVNKYYNGEEEIDDVIEKVAAILKEAYDAGPFKKISPEETALKVSKILGIEYDVIKEEVIKGAPMFDRTKAEVIMELLKRQLTAPRYIQHSARVLFVVAEADDERREKLMEAIFAPTREDLVKKVERGDIEREYLEIHDYIYDYR